MILKIRSVSRFFQKDEQAADSFTVSSDNPIDSNGITGPEKSKNDIDSLLVTEFEEVCGISLSHDS